LLGGKYQRFEVQNFDEDAFDTHTWDKIIVGWEKIFDRAENPVAVTTDNKALLMRHVPEFAEAVNVGLKSLKDTEEARAEAERKN
jgi:hypothetical protein